MAYYTRVSETSHPGDQARRITAWVSGGPGIIPPGEPVPGYNSLTWVGEMALRAPYSRILMQTAVRNGSDELISDVRAVLVTYPDGTDWGVQEWRWPEIGPGREEMTALFKDTGVRGAAQVRLEFTDANGIRWTRVGGDLRRYLAPTSTTADSVHEEVPLIAVSTRHTPEDR
jgi:hypothetical protein